MKDMFVDKLSYRAGKVRAMLLLAACAALVLGGCASTFLVSKDCRTYYFGSPEEGPYKMLCASGDLKKVLDDSALPQEIKESLYKAQCRDRSKESVKKIYASLTDDQKEELKFSFQKHGYYVNYKPVPNYQYNYYYVSNREFCPSEREY
jgi:hypothetical protein